MNVKQSTMSNAPSDPFPDEAYIDRGLYPEAYGVLANEHLMFPIDQSDWPVKIDQSRQLFVDDYLIARRQDLVRQVHEVHKCPDNPIMVGDRPWEGPGGFHHQVRRDPKSKKFRSWYTAIMKYELASGMSVRTPTCYAESEDGIHWQKPNLGCCEFEGSKENNIVIHAGSIWGVLGGPTESSPHRDFKGVVLHEPPYMPREGYYLYTSSDGIHWIRNCDEPIAFSKSKELPGIGDTSLFRWDQRLGKYIGDVKVLFRVPRTMRCRGIMESDDLVHWTRPQMTLYPDGLDDADSEIYGHLGFVYESMWIGLVRVMHEKPFSRKQTNIELTASRDGRHWTRVGKREEIIPLGSSDDWDPHYHDPATTPIIVDDELWFFYGSAITRNNPTSGKQGPYRLGLATLRRDGFVSLNGGCSPGRVVTRPLTFEGRNLYVNADIGPNGYVKAELQDLAYRPVPSHTLGEAQSVVGDVMKARVTWLGTENLENLSGQSLRLVFELKNAKLYSFWIE